MGADELQVSTKGAVAMTLSPDRVLFIGVASGALSRARHFGSRAPRFQERERQSTVGFQVEQAGEKRPQTSARGTNKEGRLLLRSLCCRSINMYCNSTRLLALLPVSLTVLGQARSCLARIPYAHSFTHCSLALLMDHALTYGGTSLGCKAIGGPRPSRPPAKPASTCVC